MFFLGNATSVNHTQHLQECGKVIPTVPSGAEKQLYTIENG